MLFRLMENPKGLLVCLLLALGLTVSSGPSQAGGVGMSLGTDGRTSAQLVCDGLVVIDHVYYLQLVLIEGALLASCREDLSGGPRKVLILSRFGRCQARENKFSFNRFNGY